MILSHLTDFLRDSKDPVKCYERKLIKIDNVVLFCWYSWLAATSHPNERLCPAIGKRCRICSKQGHFSQCCWAAVRHAHKCRNVAFNKKYQQLTMFSTGTRIRKLCIYLALYFYSFAVFSPTRDNSKQYIFSLRHFSFLFTQDKSTYSSFPLKIQACFSRR